MRFPNRAYVIVAAVAQTTQPKRFFFLPPPTATNYFLHMVALEGEMPFRTVIEPEAIEMLTKVLEQHCGKFGIRSEEGRQSVASSVLARYQRGVSDPAEIARLLEEEDR